MNCARCEKPHKGIDGLMPSPVPGRLLGHVKEHEMLCGDCMKAKSEEAKQYQQASRGC